METITQDSGATPRAHESDLRRAIGFFSAPVAAFLIPVACLVPFRGKAFHIDDPLFVLVAQQVAKQPLDFFGFDVNWLGQTQSAFFGNQNPPGWSFALAPFGLVLGWNEWSMHLAATLAAGLAGLGTYCIARRFCARPLLATVLAVFTPGFLASATSVMVDVPMLACYVWAISCWLRGMEGERDDHRWLAVSGVLIAIAMLTKFYGVTAAPLLAYYALARRGKPGAWCLHFLIPVCAFGVYEGWTWYQYGGGHLTSAMEFSMGSNQLATLSAAWNRVLTTIMFLGGTCALIAIPLIAGLSGRYRVAFAVACIALAVVLFRAERIAYFDAPWWYALQAWTAACLGFACCLACVESLTRKRDPETLLLVLWVLGTVVFCAFFNHIINVRTLVPLIPALAILAIQRLEIAEIRLTPRRSLAVLLPALALSIWVAAADAELAHHERQAAEQIAKEYPSADVQKYFLGHWGFQCYLEKEGWKSLDQPLAEQSLAEGTLIAVPAPHAGQISALKGELNTVYSFETERRTFLSAMDADLGAGFHSHRRGPLPYVFAVQPPLRYTVYRRADE